MNDFALYFKIGYQHILDIAALDHILFIFALCLRYTFADWRKLLVLITAFTIGHSITLALSILNIISFSSRWIEFFIPVTILVTSITNLYVKKSSGKNKQPFIYYLALFFGLFHGLAFSNQLRSMLGREQSTFIPLASFNIGVEAGQIIIVLAVLLVSLICLNLLKVNKRDYLIFISGGIFSVALHMALQRLPF
ncbi:MAG: HupE/UreJ family protein [Segetibacter sp.]|nr:HupE/UreJ family protein [Segetibacter sp.]